MTTEPVFNEYGEVCSDEAAEIARAISNKVGDYIKRVLAEGRAGGGKGWLDQSTST